MKSPKQQVFDSLYDLCKSINNRTFTKMPPKGTEYPFVVMGAAYKQDITNNKTIITGNVQQHIHIYSEWENKIDASNLEFEITNAARLLKHTDTFYLKENGFNSDDLIDATTGVDLCHIDLEVDYRFL